VLQTEERESRGKDCKRKERGFLPGQGISTDLPAFIDSKI